MDAYIDEYGGKEVVRKVASPGVRRFKRIGLVLLLWAGIGFMVYSLIPPTHFYFMDEVLQVVERERGRRMLLMDGNDNEFVINREGSFLEGAYLDDWFAIPLTWEITGRTMNRSIGTWRHENFEPTTDVEIAGTQVLTEVLDIFFDDEMPVWWPISSVAVGFFFAFIAGSQLGDPAGVAMRYRKRRTWRELRGGPSPLIDLRPESLVDHHGKPTTFAIWNARILGIIFTAIAFWVTHLMMTV